MRHAVTNATLCAQDFSHAQAADPNSDTWEFSVLVEACPAGCYFSPRYHQEDISTWYNIPVTLLLSTLPGVYSGMKENKCITTVYLVLSGEIFC